MGMVQPVMPSGTMIERIGQIEYGVVYSGRFNHQPLRYERLPEVYQNVLQALRQVGFDRLPRSA